MSDVRKTIEHIIKLDTKNFFFDVSNKEDFYNAFGLKILNDKAPFSVDEYVCGNIAKEINEWRSSMEIPCAFSVECSEGHDTIATFSFERMETDEFKQVYVVYEFNGTCS